MRKRSSLWRRACRRLGRDLFRFAENNEDCRFARNGEQWLLREWIRSGAGTGGATPLTLVDAGANVGDYTREALAAARLGGRALAVHVIEPSAACQSVLRERFGAEPGVRLVTAALGEVEGTAHLHDGRSGSSHASLVARTYHREGAEGLVEVRVRRLEEYLAEAGVTHVDFLKLDVEGAELPALRGAGEFLRPEHMPLIQFEYGGASLDARSSLRDLYELLSARGYLVAKLLPDALELRPYWLWMENYAYANYVAIDPRASG